MPNLYESIDAAAGTSTAYALTAGQTAQGVLGSAGDHDWYRVDLVAGQVYTFAMVGTGTDNVIDPYLRLYGPNGTLVTQNDDSLQNNNSILTYTAASSGAYYIDAGAWSDSGAGQYGVSFTAGSRASFDVEMGAGVIDTDDSWSATPGTGVNVTWGLRTTNNGAESSFFKITTAQLTAIQQILQMYSEICGLTFTQVNPGGYTDSATILFANYAANDGSGAYAYYPGSTASNSYDGDVWLNTSGGVSTTSLPMGGYSYSTIAHELGHAVGLSHPGMYNAAPGVSITYANNAQFAQDSEQYSLMSYFDESNTTGSYGSDPDTLMLFDVLALQNIYGANYATRATDTVYGFGSTAGVAAYDFQTNTNPALCIWDGGGTDTLNVSGFSQAQVINLNPGTFSNIGGLTGNVSIAFNCDIENATGGSGADRFYLSAALIDNAIAGGAGTDTVHVTYSYGAGYAVSGTAGNFTIAGTAGTDTFQSVEFIVFASGLQVSAADLVTGAPVTPGVVAISDATVTEGNSGTKIATFTVTRSGGSGAFSVQYATADGTALAGSDYAAASGSLNFSAGVDSLTVSVTISGDLAFEANETFFVNLFNATGGASISDAQGAGTIVNDDSAAAPSDDYADSRTDQSAPSGVLIAGAPVAAALEVIGDRDLFAVTLAAGHTYTFRMLGSASSAGTLLDPYLSLTDGAGKILAKDNDSGTGADAQITFLASISGTFYLSAEANKNLYAGTYELSVTESPGVTITGTDGRDVIDGTTGVNGAVTTANADTVSGLGGDDDLYGGDGDDTLAGGKGIDRLFGEDGDDTLVVTGKDDQYDRLDGGAGTDILKVNGTAALVLNGFNATAAGIEVWQGNGGAVTGTAVNDVFDFSGLASATGILYVDGGKGNDTLIGSGNGEDLRGGNGDDTLEGRGGNDRLTGAAGNDHFIFGANFGHDTIVDFTPGLGAGEQIHFAPGTFASFGAVVFTTVDGDGDGKLDDTRIAVGADSVTVLNQLSAKFVADDFVLA